MGRPQWVGVVVFRSQRGLQRRGCSRVAGLDRRDGRAVSNAPKGALAFAVVAAVISVCLAIRSSPWLFCPGRHRDRRERSGNGRVRKQRQSLAASVLDGHSSVAETDRTGVLLAGGRFDHRRVCAHSGAVVGRRAKEDSGLGDRGSAHPSRRRVVGRRRCGVCVVLSHPDPVARHVSFRPPAYD